MTGRSKPRCGYAPAMIFEADRAHDVEVVVRELAGGEIELVEPLWAALQEHHARITPALGHAAARDRSQSWRRRKTKYERWLLEPETFVFVARASARSCSTR